MHGRQRNAAEEHLHISPPHTFELETRVDYEYYSKKFPEQMPNDEKIVFTKFHENCSS